ncbi:MAG TPA: hypothetical protein DCX39_01455 [Firmicutes bacterium]|nr:hypothetical protein [Bacillota bacterium]HAW99822.1 hypothetical protein [Bacillota bacterium]
MKLTFEDKIKIVRLYVDINPEPVMNIGHKYDGKNSYEDFSGKITGLLIGRRTYFLNDIVNKFYRLTKDYLIDNQLVDNDAKTVDFSQTNLFSINQEIHNLFEIYPLQNNVVSLNGKRPIKFNIRNVSALDKDRTFNFNSINKRYSYVADGEELVYDFGISSLGTIAMRAYTDVNENKQYLFEGKDESGNVFGLFRNSNKSLVIDVNGSKLTTNLLFETNKWQSVSLSFKENISSSSQSSKYLDIRVTVDDKTWSASESVTFSYKKLDFMIGRSHKEVTIPMIFGSYKTTYPLYGQIEMIATRAAYCEASTLSSLVNELKGLTKVSEFDEFGMLKKVDIHECGNSILSNTYEYKKRSNNSKYISKQIKTEKIKVGSETYTRSYESDALGNITKITDSTFGSHSYEYDSRGFLIKADDETYSYDKNGNIVKKGDYTLTYDSNIKDRLVSFNGTKIEYDSSNPLNPRKYGSNTYQFEGRRLVRWLYGGGYYDYVYNDEGLRIKKTDYRGVTWNYIYDGNKLIRETSINNTLDFLYDEYDNLYGFIKDNSEKYLYIRDQLQNIIGITDINEKIVVKYSYDAWGALKNIEDTSSSGIGKLNPFRFKGYYYDNESRLFIVGQRYYNPEFCRFIQPVDASTLTPYSINEFNMFTLEDNSPTNNFHFNIKLNYVGLYRTNSRLLNYLNSYLMLSDFDYSKNHRNPNRGNPNSIGRIFYPDGSPKQEREYGPDGRPVVDHDHHPGEDVGYDHDHDWNWGKKPPRQPAREPNKAAAVLGIVGTGLVLIWLVANDITGFGAADDGLIPAVATSFVAFWAILFNKGDNNIW